jgi:three-Cys-motif partner protein
MTHEHHDWQLGKPPPEIRPHSLAKHRIIRSYLERYVAVLTADPRQDRFRLTLVDGFAGGGRYFDPRSNQEQSGSPLIMLEAMERASVEAQKARTKPFHLDVQYKFVEKTQGAMAYLRSILAESKFANLIDDRIQLIQGEFEEHVSEIIEFVRKRGRAGRAIFVLDQFGYLDAPMQTIRHILSTLENAEVILTFATDSLIDYLNTSEQTQRILTNLGIQIPPSSIADAKENSDWRRIIQFSLHGEIQERTGAAFYTPFFIRSGDAHRDFWLIHLSGHFRAKDVMVGVHWQQGTSFAHYGRSGLRMLGYNQKHDAEWTRQKMLPVFDFDEVALASSRESLLEELPERVFPFKDGIPFTDLFAKLTNESPVTAQIMRDVLSDLAKDGLIRVQDKTRLTARRTGIQHDSDIVIPSRQKRLFLPR